ncbi:MAG: hypothetical protein KAS70_06735 [Planctomycetes bacterium]|nr:hypothetical protein [Planctomycetota bacterium]
MKKFILCVIIFILAFARLSAADFFKEAKRNLNAALKSGNVEQVRKSADQVAVANDKNAFKFLKTRLRAVNKINDGVYWALLNAIGRFNNSEVLDEIAEFILKNKKSSLGQDALFIMKSKHSNKVLNLLKTVLGDGTDELRILALEHLGVIQTKESVKTIINFLATVDLEKKPLVIEKASEILYSLTGKNMGSDTESWMKWWSENKDRSDDIVAKPATARGNTGTVVDYLDYSRSVSYVDLKKIPPDKIIVVTGDCPRCSENKKTKVSHDFDRIQKVLAEMQIPHTTVPKNDFNRNSYKLDDKIMILFNCNFFKRHCACPTCETGSKSAERTFQCVGCEEHDHYENILSNEAIKKIQDYVSRGGYIFTEDWVIEEVLERAFRGIIRHSKYHPASNVTILPSRGGSTHPYLKGVFERPASQVNNKSGAGATQAVKLALKVGEGKWKIDEDSPDIVVQNPKLVEVLMVAPELVDKKTAGANGVVAVTFSYDQGRRMVSTGRGKKVNSGGRVLHVLSHFGKQDVNDDELALQNLLLNFLIEAGRSGGPTKNKK